MSAAPVAVLIDLYVAAERADRTGLEVSRLTNGPDYPALALIRASGAEVVVEVDPLDGDASVYRGLNEYLRVERWRAGDDLNYLDLVITAYGAYPFRV
jgi:hypothetical protein